MSAAQDQYFTYDGLYQVDDQQLGVLNGSFTGITGTPVQQEDFNYDESDNWVWYEQRNGGTLDIDQTRENNTSNQITEIDSVSTGVGYDANGNMLKVPTGGTALDGAPYKLIWDAWNRLRKVTDDEDNLLAEYEYDASTRRTTNTVGGVIRHYYYNNSWRSVEERLESSLNAERQHVWHPSERWGLILRDRSTANNGTLDERLYSMKDQMDPVAVCDTSGVVQERYAYSAFGVTAFLQDDFTPRVGNQSDYAWDWLFHGEFADESTGWYNYGYRYYLPEMGRWASRDAIGEAGGMNLYTMCNNSPMNWRDILGQSPDYPDCCDTEFKEFEDAADREKEAFDRYNDARGRYVLAAGALAAAQLASTVSCTAALVACGKAAITKAPWDIVACGVATAACAASLASLGVAAAAEAEAERVMNNTKDQHDEAKKKTDEVFQAYNDCLDNLDERCRGCDSGTPGPGGDTPLL